MGADRGEGGAAWGVGWGGGAGCNFYHFVLYVFQVFKEIFIKRKSKKPGLLVFRRIFFESIFKDAGRNAAHGQRGTLLRLYLSLCVANLCKRRRRVPSFPHVLMQKHIVVFPI